MKLLNSLLIVSIGLVCSTTAQSDSTMDCSYELNRIEDQFKDIESMADEHSALEANEARQKAGLLLIALRRYEVNLQSSPLGDRCRGEVMESRIESLYYELYSLRKDLQEKIQQSLSE